MKITGDKSGDFDQIEFGADKPRNEKGEIPDGSSPVEVLTTSNQNEKKTKLFLSKMCRIG